jgi:hypothetical protein
LELTASNPLASGAWNAADGCWTRRTTRIQRFEWNPDGTPNFGTLLPLTTEVRVPSGE